MTKNLVAPQGQRNWLMFFESQCPFHQMHEFLQFCCWNRGCWQPDCSLLKLEQCSGQWDNTTKTVPKKLQQMFRSHVFFWVVSFCYDKHVHKLLTANYQKTQGILLTMAQRLKQKQHCHRISFAKLTPPLICTVKYRISASDWELATEDEHLPYLAMPLDMLLAKVGTPMVVQISLWNSTREQIKDGFSNPRTMMKIRSMELISNGFKNPR